MTVDLKTKMSVMMWTPAANLAIAPSKLGNSAGKNCTDELYPTTYIAQESNLKAM